MATKWSIIIIDKKKKHNSSMRTKIFTHTTPPLSLSHTYTHTTPILYKQQQHRNVKAAAKATTTNDDDEPAAVFTPAVKGAAVTAAAIAALSGPLPANAAATAEFDLEAMYAEKGQTAKPVDRFEGTEVAKVVEQPKKAPKIAVPTPKPRVEVAKPAPKVVAPPAKVVQPKVAAPKATTKAATPSMPSMPSMPSVKISPAPAPPPKRTPTKPAKAPKAAVTPKATTAAPSMPSMPSVKLSPAPAPPPKRTPTKPAAGRPAGSAIEKPKAKKPEGNFLGIYNANFSNMPKAAPKKEKAPRPVQPKPTYTYSRSGPGEKEGFRKINEENKSTATSDNEIFTFVASVVSAALLVSISGKKDDKPKVQKVVSKAPATEPQANVEPKDPAEEAQEWIDAWKAKQ